MLLREMNEKMRVTRKVMSPDDDERILRLGDLKMLHWLRDESVPKLSYPFAGSLTKRLRLIGGKLKKRALKCDLG